MYWIRWFLKISASLLVVFAGIMGVSYLQKKFDDADLKKALRAIESKFPEAKSCKGQIQSRFRGLVLVQCQEGKWLVDVTRGIIETP